MTVAAEHDAQAQGGHAAELDPLRGIKLLRDVQPGDRRVLYRLMRRRQVESGDVVFRQGEAGDTMVVVLDGILRVEVTDLHGKSATVGKVEAGEVVGEMAVVDPAPRSASVVAATDCTLLELSRADLVALRRAAPSAAAAIVGGIIADVTRRLRRANKRIDDELDPSAGAGPRKVGLSAPEAAPARAGVFGRLLSRLRG